MTLSGLGRFNPLRTLAGQLILVTIAAVALSHAIGWVMFTHERGRSMRAVSENGAIDRLVAVAERIREAPPGLHEQIARASSDMSLRIIVAGAPGGRMEGRAAPRIAAEISGRLGGAETRASLRAVDIPWPSRLMIRRLGDDRRGRGPPPHDPNDVRPPPPDRDFDADDRTPTRRVDELTIQIALGPNQAGLSEWLRARAYLPTPRPIPASVWFGALFSVLAVGVAAAIIARRISRPLAQLTKAAERLGYGDAQAKAPETGPDDVRLASIAFNAMAERLGRQIERQRHMLWALSHDLRTPITALRLRAELLDDDAMRQKFLSSLADMESLTEQALALARAGASHEARVRVDVSEIIRTLCGELQDIGVNVEADAQSPIMVECRPDEIVRAMRNLAENAQKYAGGGVMTARREDKSVIVEVRDDGPGIAEADLARVTDPFFRADEARSQGAEGTGLGLAIAQAIADSHGGKLALENRAPGGLSARLILPA